MCLQNIDQYVKLVTLTTNSDSTRLRTDINQAATEIPAAFDIASTPPPVSYTHLTLPTKA